MLKITKEAMGGYDFDWAMLVHETIMAKTGYCDEYPESNGIEYTNVFLDGKALNWTERVQKDDCKQSVSDNMEGTVTFSWDHSN